MRGVKIGLAIAALVSASAEAQSVEFMNVSVPGYQRVVRLDTVISWTRVDAPRDLTYNRLRHALDELKIPVVIADSGRFFLYNASYKVTRMIAGQPMTWAWRCGMGPIEDNAATSRMTIAYAILVDTAAEGTARVGAAFAAGAQPLDGGSRHPLPCESTGALERRLLDVAQLRIVRRP